MPTAQPTLAPDGRQAFFGGWAQLWQQQPSAVAATRDAAIDTHSPGKWRANGTVSNLPAFAETFTCKDGSAMSRKADAQVSIWR